MIKACWNCGKLLSDGKFCCEKCEEEYKTKLRNLRKMKKGKLHE